MPAIFVLLDHAALPNDTDLARAFRGLQRDASVPQITRVDEPSAQGFSFELEGGEKVSAMLAAVPVPNHEADDDVRYSISAIGSKWKLPTHRAHIIVTMQDRVTRNPKRYQRFTASVAAIVVATSAVGVYWGPASATHEPRYFLKAVRSLDRALLASLWVGVDIAGPTPATVSLLSIGLTELGHKELLIAAKRNRNDFLGTFYDVVAYIIARGTPIPAGDTIGESANEYFTVRYIKSPANPKTQVLYVDMR